ncbi:MAG: imelysin family protein [Devosia sp.]
MRLLSLCLGALMSAVVILPPATAQEAVTPAQVVELAITEVFRPAFAQFAEEAASLETNLAALCTTPSADALTTAQNQFRSTFTAWSRIELYRFGPLMTENRSDAILFWPDRKGIALRQVQGALAEQDETAASAETLEGKSVAMQGFGALEFLLFGTDSESLASGADYRCKYASAIGTLLSDRADAMSAEWADPAGISQRMLQPTEADPDYRSTREALETLVGVLAHGTEAIRDQRLLPFLGRDGAAPKPKSALFWRSDMTVPSINANFAGLEALLDGSRIAEATDAENAWVANSAAFELGNAERAGALITDPIEAALADESQKRALDYLVIVTQSLDTVFGENLSAALGLSVGFSSLDGD